MDWRVTPDMAALDDEAPRVEWAENTDVSTPAERRTDFSHLAIDDDATALWGFTTAKNSWSGIHSSPDLDRSAEETNRYRFKHATGHRVGLSKAHIVVSDGRWELLLCFDKLLGMNTASEEDTLTLLADSLERSELLPAEHKATSIANFHDSCWSDSESFGPHELRCWST